MQEVPTGGRGVKGREESVSKGLRGNDEEEGTAIEVKGLDVDKPVVFQRDVAVAQGGIVGRGQFAEERLGENMGGVVEEGSVDGFENWVREVSGFPFVGGGEDREEGTGDDALRRGSKGLKVAAEEGSGHGGG